MPMLQIRIVVASSGLNMTITRTNLKQKKIVGIKKTHLIANKILEFNKKYLPDFGIYCHGADGQNHRTKLRSRIKMRLRYNGSDVAEVM